MVTAFLALLVGYVFYLALTSMLGQLIQNVSWIMLIPLVFALGAGIAGVHYVRLTKIARFNHSE